MIFVLKLPGLSLLVSDRRYLGDIFLKLPGLSLLVSVRRYLGDISFKAPWSIIACVCSSLPR